MSGDSERTKNDDVAELEILEESPPQRKGETPLLGSPEHEMWRRCYIHDRVPSVFLDRSLKILDANESFCIMFGCETRSPGTYFTRFYSPFFDESKSSELFRAVLSPAAGFAWNGRVERIGMDQLLNVSKVWIVPLKTAGNGNPPNAYSAVFLDMTTEYRSLLQNTFTSLLGAARLKDNDTGNHIERVNRYARTLAKDLSGKKGAAEVDRQFIDSISLVAALHDVGKIGTPDDILNKAGALESWEWDVMKQHTTNGAYILSTYPNPMAREIALRHHERWDGTGYPHALSEELIPLSARIVAVADVYDALRMRRTYKEAYPHERAVESIVSERGTHFDPLVVGRFAVIAEGFRGIFSELADSPESASR